jgi:hypothetical protein
MTQGCDGYPAMAGGSTRPVGNTADHEGCDRLDGAGRDEAPGGPGASGVDR